MRELADHRFVGGPVTAADAASDALGEGDGLEIGELALDVLEAVFEVFLASGGGVAFPPGLAAVALAVDGDDRGRCLLALWALWIARLGVDARGPEELVLRPFGPFVVKVCELVELGEFFCEAAGLLAWVGVDLVREVSRAYEELFVQEAFG